MTQTEAIDKTRSVIRRKHFALSTEQAYCSWVSHYAKWLVESKSAGSPEAKMEGFLSDLAQRGVSASTQNQAFNAILFFYRDVLAVQVGNVNSLRAVRPQTLRDAPSRDDVRALLGRVRDVGGYPTRLIVQMLYGAGLRVCEPLNLRIKDVNLPAGILTLKSAKGAKDRVVPIPCSLAASIKTQIDFATALSARDRQSGVPVAMPGLLSKKYPDWQFSTKWAFVFPARTTCIHPRTGETVRWRCHEANVQRCVRDAARSLGLAITPHHLRHAYATHCLMAGQNPRAIQEAMGHASLETTMGYLHADALSVKSPLESLT